MMICLNRSNTLVTRVQFYSYNVITPALCVFGIIFNSINLIVFNMLCRHEQNRCPYMYLIALAIFDNTVLVLDLIWTVVSMNNDALVWRFYDTIVMTPIINIFSFSSIWMIVTITIDRVLFVRRTNSHIYSSTFWAKIKILCIFIMAVIFNIPRFFLFNVEWSEKCKKYIPISTKFRQSMGFYIITILYAVFVHFIPLLVVFIGNVYLIKQLMKSKRNQNRSPALHRTIETRLIRDEKRLTMTLIAIIALFLVTITPSAFSDRPIAYALYNGDLSWNEFPSNVTYGVIQTIANVLIIVNCSFNFLLYWGINKKFVAALKILFQNRFKQCRRLVQRNNTRERNANNDPDMERICMNEVPSSFFH